MFAYPDSTAPVLRRPDKYAGFDVQRDTITIWHNVSRHVRGRTIWLLIVPVDTIGCLGPLGEPFATSENMLLVGGGVGVGTDAFVLRPIYKRVNLHKLSWALEYKRKPSGPICSRIHRGWRFISPIDDGSVR